MSGQITKEERPNTAYGAEKGVIPAPGDEGSEKFHYRTVEVNKATEDAGRMDRHLGMGYRLALKQGRQHIVGCLKEDQEKRSKASGKKSADRITEPAQPANRNRTSFGGRDINTVEVGKGPETAFHDN